ncbi:hypothetical protein HC022_05765 [Salipiger sp. HF18]|uniref:hypothetical protein n=1 Tax=Salipiger sp. HF18 TaxID=2721557 RepID=UPI00142D33E0|nr:hypothetical protein [Salipiger sp. HF18]NIY95772.1 hypothetical protein [Salipiger sp. HF18]
MTKLQCSMGAVRRCPVRAEIDLEIVRGSPWKAYETLEVAGCNVIAEKKAKAPIDLSKGA